MDRKKVKYIYYIIGAQLILQIIFLFWGFNFKSDSNVISSTVLGMVSKVQTTTDLENFVWLFTHNFVIMFLIFWVSYVSFGVIGTFWCINNTFMLGVLTKLYLTIINNAWLTLLFMSLELIATTLVMISSTTFRIEKHKLKKTFKCKLTGFDEKYIKEKQKIEKNILFVFGVIAVILLVAAIIETVVLSSI